MFCTSLTEESQQVNGVMQLYTNDINQIRNSHPKFSFYYRFEKYAFGQERHNTGRQACLYHSTQGLPALG
jgi:hypothetical protein